MGKVFQLVILQALYSLGQCILMNYMSLNTYLAILDMYMIHIVIIFHRYVNSDIYNIYLEFDWLKYSCQSSLWIVI